MHETTEELLEIAQRLRELAEDLEGERKARPRSVKMISPSIERKRF